MRICLLTGATGFLGAHVARALVEEGWRVRALVRGGEARLSGDLRDRVEPFDGDLSPSANLAGASAGVQAIVHVAGVVKARTFDEYREVNARGTARLVAAASAAAPDAHFVLVSSQAAAGPSRDGLPVEESDDPRPVSWYGRSKLEGEEAVASGWRGPWTVVRPSVVFGPGDRGLLVLFRAAARGVLPVPAGSSRVQVIRAERAARAIARVAGRRDLSGRRAFLGDPDILTIRALSVAIAGVAPKRPRLLPVPRAAVRLAGAFETGLEMLTRRSRPFNADKAREILAGDWIANAAPLSRDLALEPPEPLARGLRETWDWYIRSRWLTL